MIRRRSATNSNITTTSPAQLQFTTTMPYYDSQMIHTRSLTKNYSYSNIFKYNSYALQNTRTVLLRSELYRLLHFLCRTLQWHSSV